MENYFYDTHIYQYKDELMRYVLLRIPDRGEAEDIVQSVMIDAWVNLNRFKAEESELPLLYTIAKRKISHFRRKKIPMPTEDVKIETMSLATVERDVLDCLLRQDDIEAIFRAINNLETQSIQIIILCLVDGFSIKKASRILGINYNTAIWRKNKALLSLRASLTDKGIRPSVKKKTFYTFILLVRWFHNEKQNRKTNRRNIKQGNRELGGALTLHKGSRCPSTA